MASRVRVSQGASTPPQTASLARSHRTIDAAVIPPVLPRSPGQPSDRSAERFGPLAIDHEWGGTNMLIYPTGDDRGVVTPAAHCAICAAAGLGNPGEAADGLGLDSSGGGRGQPAGDPQRGNAR